MGGQGSALCKCRAPKGIHPGPDGGFFVVDGEFDCVRFVREEQPDQKRNIFAAGGGRGNAADQLNRPHGISWHVKAGLLVADTYNHRVQLFKNGQKAGLTVAGGLGRGKGLDHLDHPHGVGWTSERTFLVIDRGNHRIQEFDLSSPSGKTVAEDGDVTYSDIAVRPDGSFFVTTEYSVQYFEKNAKKGVIVGGDEAVKKADRSSSSQPHHRSSFQRGATHNFAASSTPASSVFEPSKKGSSMYLHGPQGLIVGLNGGIIVADTEANRVMYFPDGHKGTMLCKAEILAGKKNCLEPKLEGPRGVAISSGGKLLVTDHFNDCVRIYANLPPGIVANKKEGITESE